MRKRIFFLIIRGSSNPKRIGIKKPAFIKSGFSFLFKTQTIASKN